jgi:hypothetical protein
MTKLSSHDRPLHVSAITPKSEVGTRELTVTHGWAEPGRATGHRLSTFLLNPALGNGSILELEGQGEGTE